MLVRYPLGPQDHDRIATVALIRTLDALYGVTPKEARDAVIVVQPFARGPRHRRLVLVENCGPFSELDVWVSLLDRTLPMHVVVCVVSLRKPGKRPTFPYTHVWVDIAHPDDLAQANGMIVQPDEVATLPLQMDGSSVAA